MPVSVTSCINSRISSIVMQSTTLTRRYGGEWMLRAEVRSGGIVSLVAGLAIFA
jgi:hypothetical protein